jgi:hypothetical protein
MPPMRRVSPFSSLCFFRPALSELLLYLPLCGRHCSDAGDSSGMEKSCVASSIVAVGTELIPSEFVKGVRPR